ncbi:MAG TPA: segregation/condensation protein A [Candidatus Eisenbacteria bacterium]
MIDPESGPPIGRPDLESPAREAPAPGAAPPSVATAEAVPSRRAAGLAPGSPPVLVKLERFEGPLDLLLHLIKRDEIDIYDIPIAHITQQYLAYLELMRSLDLEVAGEFLVMAATLMRIKAKMLLPLPGVGDEEEEGDPREELVQRLVEYRQFKEAASTLQLREEERRRLYERGLLPGEDEAGPLPLAPATLFDLLDALSRVMARVPETTVYDVRGEVYDLEEKMSLIARTVAEDGAVQFATLLMRCHARAEMIVTFIALLELVKLGQVSVVQAEHFGDISIVARAPEERETDASAEPPGGA